MRLRKYSSDGPRIFDRPLSSSVRLSRIICCKWGRGMFLLGVWRASSCNDTCNYIMQRRNYKGTPTVATFRVVASREGSVLLYEKWRKILEQVVPQASYLTLHVGSVQQGSIRVYGLQADLAPVEQRKTCLHAVYNKKPKQQFAV